MTDIRVLIVEDEPLIAEDIADTLIQMAYQVAGIAYSSERALDMLSALRPDIVLLDINIQGSQNGIAVGRAISERYNIPFIFLTSYGDRQTIDEAKKTMPYGYVLKPFAEAELLSAIEIALYRFANEHRNDQLPPLAEVNKHTLAPLTQKEYDLLSDICKGLNNKQIAENHFVSVNTVKTHIRQLLAKLDVPNRTSIIHKLGTM